MGPRLPPGRVSSQGDSLAVGGERPGLVTRGVALVAFSDGPEPPAQTSPLGCCANCDAPANRRRGLSTQMLVPFLLGPERALIGTQPPPFLPTEAWAPHPHFPAAGLGPAEIRGLFPKGLELIPWGVLGQGQRGPGAGESTESPSFRRDSLGPQTLQGLAFPFSMTLPGLGRRGEPWGGCHTPA